MPLRARTRASRSPSTSTSPGRIRSPIPARCSPTRAPLAIVHARPRSLAGWTPSLAATPRTRAAPPLRRIALHLELVASSQQTPSSSRSPTNLPLTSRSHTSRSTRSRPATRRDRLASRMGLRPRSSSSSSSTRISGLPAWATANRAQSPSRMRFPPPLPTPRRPPAHEVDLCPRLCWPPRPEAPPPAAVVPHRFRPPAT
mmetsp:Transcript_13560/g.40911  ORF Transcript_13560/g.40911 Transcript_13560/m.40911 type:complete len:200 (+) Transcript_13560:2545-3144(+)